MNSHVFRGMDACGLKAGPAAPIETFARFQAGFLSSEDFQRFPLIFIVFYRFLRIFIDFHGSSCISRYGCLYDLCGLKRGPAAPIETFARFQAGFLSSEDVRRFYRFS